MILTKTETIKQILNSINMIDPNENSIASFNDLSIAHFVVKVDDKYYIISYSDVSSYKLEEKADEESFLLSIGTIKGSKTPYIFAILGEFSTLMHYALLQSYPFGLFEKTLDLIHKRVCQRITVSESDFQQPLGIKMHP